MKPDFDVAIIGEGPAGGFRALRHATAEVYEGVI